MNKRFKIAIFLFCFIWLLTAIQFLFSPFKLVGLRGAFYNPPVPTVTFDKIISGKFQKETEIYTTLKTPFRADFIRVKNQLGYTFFDEINTNLTLGKDHYLFDPNYISAFKGEDLLPYKERLIQASAIGSLKSIVDSLGINLFWVIAPNKANYYQEFLKDSIHFQASTNQAELIAVCERNKVPYIDTDDWFLKEKKKSKYPLVPKYGAHWTTYGAALVSDSLDNLLNGFFPNKVQTSIGEIKESSKARFSDNDYLPSLNLIQKWEWDTILGYPGMVYQPGKKIKALIISDSYMWNFYDNDFFQQNFTADSKFLYYNKAFFNVNRDREGEKKAGDIKLERLKGFETIIFIGTGPSFKESYSYHFIEELLNE